MANAELSPRLVGIRARANPISKTLSQRIWHSWFGVAANMAGKVDAGPAVYQEIAVGVAT